MKLCDESDLVLSKPEDADGVLSSSLLHPLVHHQRLGFTDVGLGITGLVT